jgi:hypothetical protein
VCDARAYGLVGDGVTNDQPALAALVDTLGAGHARDGRRRVVYCPPGTYAIHDRGTVWRSGVSLVGAGPAATRFVLANPGDPGAPTPLAVFTTQEHGAGPDNHLADCTFAGFTIDGSGVALDGYDYLAKGLGLQYVRRGVFRDLAIRHTAATGLGCDFLQDTVVRHVRAVGCGRRDDGREMGGAGIGIGIGGWGDEERLLVTGCTATHNSTHGIFVELQEDHRRPPRGIRITGCHLRGNRYGVSDWGARGLVVEQCTMTANLEAGYNVSAQGTGRVAGRGGLLTDCVVTGNAADGVWIGDTPGPYVVRRTRISRNGRYGYRQHGLSGRPGPTRPILLEGNVIERNRVAAVHLDRPDEPVTLVGNVIDGQVAGPRQR